jgi:hypothetical protein
MDFEKQKSTDEGKAAQVYASSRLKIQAPKIHRSLLKLNPQFPSRSPFVAPPNQDRFASILIYQVDQDKALPHWKILGNNG